MRVEQLYPFPAAETAASLANFPAATRSRLVPGRAAEPGRVVPDPAPPAAPACSRASSCSTPVARAAAPAPAIWPRTSPSRPSSRRALILAPRSQRRFAQQAPQTRQDHEHRSQSSGPARIRFRRHHRDLAQEGRRRGQARREPRRPRDRQGRARSALAGRRRAQGNHA